VAGYAVMSIDPDVVAIEDDAPIEAVAPFSAPRQSESSLEDTKLAFC
jgi:hypothetical protein